MEMTEHQKEHRDELEEFIKRAGFTHGWLNLESWARRMAEQAVAEVSFHQNAYTRLQELQELVKALHRVQGTGASMQEELCALFKAVELPCPPAPALLTDVELHGTVVEIINEAESENPEPPDFEEFMSEDAAPVRMMFRDLEKKIRARLGF